MENTKHEKDQSILALPNLKNSTIYGLFLSDLLFLRSKGWETGQTVYLHWRLYEGSNKWQAFAEKRQARKKKFM